MVSLNKFFEDVYSSSILLAFIKLCEMKASDIATPFYIAIKDGDSWVAQPKENPLCYTSEEEADAEIENMKKNPKNKDKLIRKFTPDSNEIKNQVNDPYHQGNPRITHNKEFYQQEEIKSKPRHKIIKLGSIGYPRQNTEKK